MKSRSAASVKRDATIKLRDVAKAAGVSQGTASNVFSKPDVVREEVREHVLKVSKELGYAGPSVTGRLLRQGKVNAVGVAAIEPISYFFEDLWAPPADGADFRHLRCAWRRGGAGLGAQRRATGLEYPVGAGGWIYPAVRRRRRKAGGHHPATTIALCGAGDRGDRQQHAGHRCRQCAGARMAAEHLLGLGHAGLPCCRPCWRTIMSAGRMSSRCGRRAIRPRVTGPGVLAGPGSGRDRHCYGADLRDARGRGEHPCGDGRDVRCTGETDGDPCHVGQDCHACGGLAVPLRHGRCRATCR